MYSGLFHFTITVAYPGRRYGRLGARFLTRSKIFDAEQYFRHGAIFLTRSTILNAGLFGAGGGGQASCVAETRIVVRALRAVL